MQFVLLHLEYRGDAQTFVIGDVETVVPFSIGSSRGNEVIIDDPAVPEYVTTYQFGGHHGIIHAGGRGPLEAFAGYRATVLWTDDLSTVNLESRIPTRVLFRPGYGELHTIADDDPRRRELDRLTRVAAPPLNDARCEELIVEHLRALSYATRGREPLRLGRIDITSDLAAAVDRYVAAWGAEDEAPFSPASWSYVHRFHAWAGLLADDKVAIGEALASRVKALDRGPAIHQLLGLHLATLGDDDSPFRALVTLWSEGVTTLAVPGGSFVLYAPHADRPELAARVAREHALRDEPAVLADFIEEGGEPRRAAIVRSGVRITNQRERLKLVKWFPNARGVMLPATSALAPPVVPALAEITPPAFLVIDGKRMPLGRTNIFHIERGRLRCDPISDDRSNIVCRGDARVFWLDEGEFHGMELNGAAVRAPIPLFDGDLIRVRALHPQGVTDTVATFHLGT